MRESVAADAPCEAMSTDGLATRYEAFIRFAELIRSHLGEKDLFPTLASDLHEAVPFDGPSQFDPTANWVSWHFVELYSKEAELRVVTDIPKEETIAWWGYRNQQPVVMRFVVRETRFPLAIESRNDLPR